MKNKDNRFEVWISDVTFDIDENGQLTNTKWGEMETFEEYNARMKREERKRKLKKILGE